MKALKRMLNFVHIHLDNLGIKHDMHIKISVVHSQHL